MWINLVLVLVVSVAILIIAARLTVEDDFETEEKDLYLRWLEKQDNRTKKGRSTWPVTKKQDLKN